MPNIDGEQWKNTHYSLHRYQNCPLQLGEIGEYSFKSSATDKQQDTVVDGISQLVREMEEIGHTLICVLPEHKEFIVTKTCLTYLWLVDLERDAQQPSLPQERTTGTNCTPTMTSFVVFCQSFPTHTELMTKECTTFMFSSTRLPFH